MIALDHRVDDVVRDLGTRGTLLALASDEYRDGRGGLDAIDTALCDLRLAIASYDHLTGRREMADILADAEG